MRNRIEFLGYALIPEQGRFNAIKLTGKTHVRKDNGKVYESNIILGYSMAFDTAVLRVIEDILIRKILKGEVTTLKEYITEYRKLKEEIKKMLT